MLWRRSLPNLKPPQRAPHRRRAGPTQPLALRAFLWHVRSQLLVSRSSRPEALDLRPVGPACPPRWLPPLPTPRLAWLRSRSSSCSVSLKVRRPNRVVLRTRRAPSRSRVNPRLTPLRPLLRRPAVAMRSQTCRPSPRLAPSRRRRRFPRASATATPRWTGRCFSPFRWPPLRTQQLPQRTAPPCARPPPASAFWTQQTPAGVGGRFRRRHRRRHVRTCRSRFRLPRWGVHPACAAP
jgi:hypothetical protein